MWHLSLEKTIYWRSSHSPQVYLLLYPSYSRLYSHSTSVLVEFKLLTLTWRPELAPSSGPSASHKHLVCFWWPCEIGEGAPVIPVPDESSPVPLLYFIPHRRKLLKSLVDPFVGARFLVMVVSISPWNDSSLYSHTWVHQSF